MRILAILALLLASTAAQARWLVSSEFQLQLTDSIFDQIVEDFWQTVQGTQKAGPENYSFTAGNTRIQANGVGMEINYAFTKPQRVSQTQREWAFESQSLSARITAQQLLITQRQVISQDGLVFETDITVECRNVALKLPTGLAKVSARVRAEIAQNQVNLTLPHYEGHWPTAAWQIESLNCPQLANIQGEIQSQIVATLSSFDNVNSEVGDALADLFADWSKRASVLLMSERELPSESEDVKIFYEPKLALETSGNGLLLSGELRFEYPNVSPDRDERQVFRLPEGSKLDATSGPQLLVPFEAIRALIVGQYFAGKVEYALRSTEVEGFQSLMQSRLKQLFAWPDLLNFSRKTVFLFQFLPMGPPAIENARGSGTNSISVDLDLPVSVRMFAPFGGMYSPYIEFRTRLKGPTKLALQSGGKVLFKVSATEQPVSFAFAKKYVDRFDPIQRIAVKTLASATRDALSAEGLNVTFPTITVGSQLALQPTSWSLQKGGVLKVEFGAKAGATAAAQKFTTVKTSNGKTLRVRSAR